MDIESQRRRNRELQRLITERDTRLQIGISIGQEAVSHLELDGLESEEAIEVTVAEPEFSSPIDKHAARLKRKYAQ